MNKLNVQALQKHATVLISINNHKQTYLKVNKNKLKSNKFFYLK